MKFLPVVLGILLCAALVVAVPNDPGHDSLYIEEDGNSTLTGKLNISSSLRIGERLYGDYLDLRGDDDASGTNRILGRNGFLQFESTAAGLIHMFRDVAGQVRIGTPSLASTLNVSGSIYMNGTRVCLANGTDCISGNNSGNVSSVTAGAGLVNSGTSTAVIIDVVAGSGLSAQANNLTLLRSCTVNQTLQYVGSSWICASLSGATAAWTNTSGNATYSGRVGINTTTPDLFALQVDGDIGPEQNDVSRLGGVEEFENSRNLSSASASFYGEAASDSSGQYVSGVGDVNGDGISDFLIGAPGNDEGGSGAGQSYLFFGNASGWSLDTNLSDADASFIGEAASDSSGRFYSGVGDVNGDGFADFLIGAMYNDEGGADSGQSYLFFGNASGWSMDTNLSDADASFIGEAASDRSGLSVSGVGDVNGDGFADFLIGAYGNDEGGNLAGQSYLFFGKSSGWSMDTNLSSADASFIGEAAEDYSGISGVGVGDVNGDGFSDFLIGAYGNSEGAPSAGQSYLFFGKSSGWSMDTDLSDADASFIGEAANDYSGYSGLSGVGDVDGDGFSDFLIGAYGNDEGNSSAGQSYLFFGKSSGWSMDTNLSSADASFIAEGQSDISGRSVSGVGDVDGDGFSDFLIDASRNNEGGDEAGQSYLFYGKPSGWSMDTNLSSADASFIGEAEYDYSGQSVSGVGDVNGDGFADFLIGATGNDEGGDGAGQSYLILSEPRDYKSINARHVHAGATVAVGDLLLRGDTISSKSQLVIAGDVTVEGGVSSKAINVSGDVLAQDVCDSSGCVSEVNTTLWTLATSGVYLDALVGIGTTDTSNFTLTVEGDISGSSFTSSDSFIVRSLSAQNVTLGSVTLDAGAFSGLTQIPTLHIYSSLNTTDATFARNVSGSDVCAGSTCLSTFSVFSELWTNTSGNATYVGGNVGINTTTPDLFMLQVDGDIGPQNNRTNRVGGVEDLPSNVNSSTLNRTLASESSFDYFGTSLAAGDVNGDGVNDVIVGAEMCSSCSDVGRVYLFFGNATRWNESAGFDASLHGDQVFDHFGTDVASGDVNGDGYADIIVAAKNHSGSNLGAGKVFVYFGNASGWSSGITTDAAQASFEGVNASDDIDRVATGDINNDGFADIIIGAEDYEETYTSQGVVYVIFGKQAGWETNVSLNDADVKILGMSTNDEFGTSVAAGDITGDGKDELLIGDPNADTGGNVGGHVFVFNNRDDWSGITSGSNASTYFYGNAGDYELGKDIVIGDVDGDGIGDVIAGSWPDSKGQVDVYLGSTSLPSASNATWKEFPGTFANEFMGQAVGTADITGDGKDDILIGSANYDISNNEGGFFVVPSESSSTNVSDFIVYYGEDVSDNMGFAVLGAGDINGDGFADAVVSAYGDDSYGTNSGRVFVLLAEPRDYKSINARHVHARDVFLGGLHLRDNRIEEPVTIDAQWRIQGGLATVTMNSSLYVNATTVCASGTCIADITAPLWTNTSDNATYADGRVGIGTTTPSGLVSVNGTGVLVTASNTSETVFSIASDGEVFSDQGYYSPAVDLAERYASVEALLPGQVVVIDSERDVHVRTTTIEGDVRVAGIVSTKPGVVLGDAGYPIALKGRVPILVDREVVPGDYLMSSAVQGRATVCAANCSGKIVARALTQTKDDMVIGLVMLK